MSKFGFIQSKLGQAGATAIQADSQPLAIADNNDRPGWKYVKDAASAVDDKFNWYFYGGAYETLKCKDVRSLFMCGSVDKWTNLSTEAPFFVLYTKPTGSGDQAAWYHSRHSWSIHMGSQLVREGERCVFYCLEKPEDNFDGARQVALKTRIDTGEWNDNNEVLYCTLHSDSGAAAMECLVEHMGMDCHSFSRLPKSTLNIKCVV